MTAAGASDPKRDADVLWLYRQGWTLRRLAARYGFTKERARQIKNRAMRQERRPADVLCQLLNLPLEWKQ